MMTGMISFHHGVLKDIGQTQNMVLEYYLCLVLLSLNGHGIEMASLRILLNLKYLILSVFPDNKNNFIF